MWSLFSFSGALNRRDWLWRFGAAAAVQAAVIVLLDSLASLVTADEAFAVFGLVLVLATLANAWVMVAGTAKRAHCFGRSPWGCLMLLVPVFGWMLALIYYGQSDDTALRGRA